MTLRCASCGRSVRSYTVTVTTADGARGYGPVCARVRGLLVKDAKSTAPVKSHGTTDDASQLTLELA